ncbi:MAG: EamA family transporter RarD [Planctomycetota bacterium]
MGSLAEDSNDNAARAKTGLLFGFAAYGWWAFLFPLHLRVLNSVTPEGVTSAQVSWSLEVLAHRLVWSLLLCLILCAMTGKWQALREALRDRRTLRQLGLTATLVTINWLVFIVAMARGELYRAGIGYFLTPIVQIALGTMLLGETLRRGQWLAIALTGCGMVALVAVGIARGSGVPWIEASLAASFGFYGLVRKRAQAGPVVGLTIETGWLAPLALTWLWLAPGITASTAGFLEGGTATQLLLAATGLSTTLPLLCFAAAAARLPLSTIGFLQFLAPTGQFLLSIFAFGERPTDPRLWIGYALIGAGVLALVGEGVRARWRARRPAAAHSA